MNRPSIFEAAGGAPVFEVLTSRFYRKVKADPLLSPVFASFTAEHARNVAIWLGEVFGGPTSLLRGAWRSSHGASTAPQSESQTGTKGPMGRVDARNRSGSPAERCRTASAFR